MAEETLAFGLIRAQVITAFFLTMALVVVAFPWTEAFLWTTVFPWTMAYPWTMAFPWTVAFPVTIAFP